MTYKIIGMDESGKMGDPHIIFSHVEFNEIDEPKIFIMNLMNSGDFLLSKEFLENTKAKKLVQVSHQILSNNFIKAKFYKMIPKVQNDILKDTFKYQAMHLFKIRSHLISFYKKKKFNLNTLNKIIRNLSHYDKAHRLPDYSIKSYSFLYILNNLCDNYNICEFLKKEENFIKVQIDGGHIFSFWWFYFINSHTNKEIIQNKVFINGIPNGDNHYLSMNIADLISKSYRNNSSKFLDYEIIDIKYNFREISFSNEIFHNSVWKFLAKNVFKKRMIFIGKSEFFNIIPYLFHRKNRRIIYEPFQVKGDIEHFFRKHSRGNPDQNIAIIGEKLDKYDKNNIKICHDKKIEISTITDLNDDFNAFFNLIETSMEDYSYNVKLKIRNIINQKKELLKNIQEVNLH